MTLKARHRGHPIELTGTGWEYLECSEYPKGNDERPCAACGCISRAGEPDFCLGHLSGVEAACCGHGIEEDAHIWFTNGQRLVGSDVARLRSIWTDNMISPNDVIKIFLCTKDLDNTVKFCKLANHGFEPFSILQILWIVT